MTAARAKYAQGLAVTANSTTWVDVCTIAAGDFDASEKYLIVANALVRHASSLNEVRLRLVHGTTPTVFDDASLAYELTADTQEVNASWMYVWTQPGTAELVKLQLSVSATNTATCELGQIFALNLDDVGSDGTDYHYNEDLSDYTTTGSKVAEAAITFTPNGTDTWLVIGQAAYLPGSATANALMDLNDSVTGALVSIDIEGEDVTNEVRASMLMAAVTPSNASHTYSVRFSHETTAGTIFSSRVFALKLNKFNQHSITSAAGQEAPAADPSWTTTRTLSPTPSVTGDWFYWGYVSVDHNVQADDLKMRLQVNPSGGGLVSDPAYTDSSPGADTWDPTDISAFNIFKMRSLSSGAARDINLDASMVTGTTLRVQERTLIAFSLELAGGGSTQVDTTYTASASFATLIDTTYTASASFATLIDTTYTASASFATLVDKTYTASASFQGTIDTTYTASASFAVLVDTTYTASASFAVLVDTTYTASASFATLVDKTYTASASFQGTIDTTYTASASFAAEVTGTKDTSYTASASFVVLETVTALPFAIPSYDASYELKVVHPTGYYTGVIDHYVEFDYTIVLNDIGVLNITLPGDYPIATLAPDTRIEIWRAIGDGAPRLEGDTQFLVQTITKSVDESANRLYKIVAYTLNHILSRRVVAYNSDATQAFQVDQADDMIKLILDQNYGATALDTERNISSTLSISAQLSNGPSIAKDMAYKNVLDTIKEIADTSWQKGTPLFFDIICNAPPSGMLFQTYTTVRGVDRRSTSGNPLLIGFAYGSIGAYSITTDYNEEATYIYALGPGEGSLQLVQTTSDTTRNNRSAYGRRELVVSNNDADTANSLLDFAKAALLANRPRKVFEGKLINIPSTLYGVHWGLGDYVTAEADEEQFDCYIWSVHVSVNQDGDSVDASLRNDNTSI